MQQPYGISLDIMNDVISKTCCVYKVATAVGSKESIRFPQTADKNLFLNTLHKNGRKVARQEGQKGHLQQRLHEIERL